MSRNNENHWVFGRGAHLEFENGTDIVVHAPAPIECWEGSASIADPQNGELLFYTDGEKLWNAAHVQITTGLGSNQSITSQTPVNGAIIVPPIAPATNYHVFSTAAIGSGVYPQEGPTNDLMHTLISVSGTGVTATIARNSPTTGVWAGEKTTDVIACTYNSDCTGYWVVTQRFNTTVMHIVAVNSDTLGPFTVQNFTMLNSFSGYGMMKFSSDASMLVFASPQHQEIIVFNFDNATGVLTYRCKITGIIGDVYGVEFSPDNQLLYYTTIRSADKALYQAPVSVIDTLHSSSFLVHDGTIGPDEDWFGSLQLGPDNKIYVSQNDGTHISSIDNPNIVGGGCNFTEFVLDKYGNQIAFNNIQTFGFPSLTRIDQACIVEDMTKCCLFPWGSGSVLNHHSSTAALEPVKVSFATYNKPGSDLNSHQSLMPLPYDAMLVDLAFVKDPDVSNFAGTILFDLVVHDFAGTLIRTISANSIDYQAAPGWTWIDVPLTSNALDLNIASGEIVAGRLTFGSMPSSGIFAYQMTGRGKFL